MFGYGSLARGAGGSAVVRLAGWERCWGVAMDNRRDLPGYKYYTDPDGTRPAVRVAFPDIRPGCSPAVDSGVLGVLQRIGADELPALDRRERNYRRIDVTALLGHGVRGSGRVWAYVGTEEGRGRLAEGLRALREGRPDGIAVIHGQYLRAVLAAFDELGAAPGAQCRRSLSPGPLPVRQLVRHDLPDDATPARGYSSGTGTENPLR